MSGLSAQHLWDLAAVTQSMDVDPDASLSAAVRPDGAVAEIGVDIKDHGRLAIISLDKDGA